MNRELDPVNTAAAPRQEIDAATTLLRDVARAVARDPSLDPDTVRHALALLRLDPLSRLNRSLIRGRAAAHRT